MALIVSCDFEEAKQYRGKMLKSKYNGKRHTVYLNVICDDFTMKEAIAFARANSCVLMVEYQGSDMYPLYLDLKESDTSGVHMIKTYEQGVNLTNEDVEYIIEKTPSGVTPVIMLPESFVDIKVIYDLSKQYPNVRFSGGTLFPIDGCNVGRFGMDTVNKHNIKISQNDSVWAKNDIFEEVNIKELDIELSDKQEKSFSSGSQKKSTAGGGGTKKRLFSQMLSAVGDGFDL